MENFLCLPLFGDLSSHLFIHAFQLNVHFYDLLINHLAAKQEAIIGLLGKSHGKAAKESKGKY